MRALNGPLALVAVVMMIGSSGHGSPELSSKRAPRKDEARAPIDVPPEQQERLGLRTTVVETKELKHQIRTVGVISTDQRSEAHVHTRINGWIERIFADYVGKPIKKGQPLFELYSPELVSTQEEYLAAKKQGSSSREIANASLDRLKLWGVPDSEILRLTKTSKSKRALTFEAPVDGYIVNKTAIQGMYVTPEMELYHIADLSKVWVMITLYEYDIATVKTGDEVAIQLPYDPTQAFGAKVSYVYPEIEPETRTAKARIELRNPEQNLKPGMFVNVEIAKNLGASVVVPDDSVIDTGTRRIVFVKTGPARFEPREIKIGPRVGDSFAVFSGLKAGETVVSSAHFLIDAESKFQAAVEKSGAPQGGHAGHGGK